MLATINIKVNDEWTELPAIKGKDGVGVPTGGTTGQVLAKLSNNDFDFKWITSEVTINDIPTKTSELTNDSGFISSIPNEYVTDSELNAKGYLTEHQDISHLATKNEIPSIDGLASETYVTNYAQPKGDYLTSIPSEYITETELNNAISSKANKNDIPVNNNQLINGAGYQTSSDVNTAIGSAIANIQGISYSVVETLPTTGEAGYIYLVSNNGENPNIYDEYIWVNETYEKIGTTEIDLSNYATKDELPTIPTDISSFNNDAGYITEVPSEYITETELNDKGYLTNETDPTVPSYVKAITTAQITKWDSMRTIYTSTSSPTANDGVDGDIWIIYEG